MYPIETQTFPETFQQPPKSVSKAIEILITFKRVILHIVHKLLILCLKLCCHFRIIFFIFLILISEIQRSIVLELSHSLFLKVRLLSLLFLHQLFQ